ncbi:hypothetical protein BJY04DRAFT_216611 [Aspergillus karnatakaensis]|uniref:putative SNF2 family helicase/ATPase n=1 Tax=Aspergillus karnatakaensis TaxID=1810916 RepID=UPI003CCCDAB4
MQSHADPLDWTVDEVVDFLCHNTERPWSLSTTQLPQPDSDFERSLRENLITGEVLLQDVDKQVLRDDLGLKALGHRSLMIKAIQHLQQVSRKFQQINVPGAEQNSALPSPSPFQVLAHHQTTSYPSPASHPELIPSHNMIHKSPLSTTPLLNRPVSTAVISGTPILAGAVDQVQRPEDTPVQESSAEDSSARSFFAQEQTKHSTSTRARPHEQIVDDGYGRKRRRLNLALAEIRNDELPSKHSEDKGTVDWYMGPEVLSPNQLFYSPDPIENELAFTIVSSTLPTGQRKFVNKRLRHFFQQSPIWLSHFQRAVVPYSPSLIKPPGNSFFTLYNMNQGTTDVRKENIHDWPQLTHQLKLDGAQSSKSSDPFSYLLQKYPVREDLGDAYPVYGDSGSEGEYDEDTWKEIEEERSEPMPLQRTKFGPTEISSIIQSCITAYENNWREIHQAKEEPKAQKIWLAARRGKRVNQEVKALLKDINLLGTRLQKLQDELVKVDYATPAEVCTQCQCLEYTVLSIQKQKWRISVLQQDECPPKVVAPPRSRWPKFRGGDEDEISLYSDSDFIENDVTDDYMVDYNETNQSAQVENPPWSPASSDDDDIISVSGARRRTRGQPPRVFASSSSPSYSPPNIPLLEKPDVIDLTMESPESSEPEDYTIETPPLNPVRANKSNISSPSLPKIGSSMSPPPSLGSLASDIGFDKERRPCSLLPPIDELDDILSTNWELIEERQDRRRLLAKLIGSLSDGEREDLAESIPQYQFVRLKSLAGQALRCLMKGSNSLKNLTERESSRILRTAALYVSWVSCVHLDDRGIRKNLVKAALDDLQDRQGQGFGKYYDELIDRLKSSQAWKRTEAGSPVLDLKDSPHKKRKREVKESQSAKMTQANAQRRVALQEKQREKLQKQLGNSAGSLNKQPVSFKDPVIYLDPYIGARVKPHQLTGIQFMWRELIEDKNRQGCLLAHTMGLGKTMQVISLLSTISAAAASPDPAINEQIPERFRRSQTLILCPSSLIDNWQDEFVIWTPESSSIGLVRRISTTDNVAARLREVSDWYMEGGVLLISYDVFRGWINNKSTPKRPKPLSDAEHDDVKNWLLNGPSIIVADEAHKMKNSTSAISLAAIQFKSKSRIALTGSPLANNLGDYYTMVDWIAKDYLGTYVQFKAHYSEPIEEGLYADSSHHEKRRSLVKLQVLKKILEPKINRADISVVEGSLPPKVEFVLTMPLTALQKAAYDSYVAFVLNGTADVGQARLWSWLAILGLCCSHPSCFREKLNKRANNTSKPNDDEQAIPGDEDITQAGLPELDLLIDRQKDLFAQVPDMLAVQLSVRAEIVNRIVAESIAADDKVLIFSQSLPTLNYLEHMLKTSGRLFSRLDGKTPIAGRQAATKEFNRDGGKQVYLISTRAGGLGLNIPGANRVIIFDFSFNPVWEEQAVGRAYRLGQQKPVYVYRFVAGGTFEEIIHHKAVFKTQLSVRVVDKKNPVRYASKKPGDYLFPAKQVKQQDIIEYVGKDKLVLDKILLEDEKRRPEDRLIRGITLTQTFHKEDNDKLTEEENKSVQEELHLEHLKHTDPEAYAKKMTEMMHERYAQQMHQLRQHQQYQPQQPINVSSIPQSAHNTGPPALAPDTSAAQIPCSNPSPNTLLPFSPHAQGFRPSGLVPARIPSVPGQAQPPIQSSTQRTTGENQPGQSVDVTNPPQQTAPMAKNLSAGNPVTPGLVLLQTPTLSAAHHHHPPTAPSRTGSEPLKPNSPATDSFAQQMFNERQGLSPRGQSVPHQLDDPFVQASASSAQSLAEDQPARERRNTGCRNQ